MGLERECEFEGDGCILNLGLGLVLEGGGMDLEIKGEFEGDN